MAATCMGTKLSTYTKKRTKKDCNVYKKSKNSLNAKKLMEREGKYPP